MRLSSLQVIGKKDLWSIGAIQASKSSPITRPVRSVQSMTSGQTPIHGCGATAQPETEMAPGSRFLSLKDKHSPLSPQYGDPPCRSYTNFRFDQDLLLLGSLSLSPPSHDLSNVVELI